MRHSPIAFRRTTFPLLALSLLLTLALLSACGGGTAATAPTATRSATATATPEPGTFYFTTDDNVTLSGKIVGTGTTAIVFSSMDGDPKVDWQDLAPLLASRGYMTFSYDYRGLGASQGHYDRSKIASDLNAAIQSAQQHGATKYRPDGREPWRPGDVEGRRHGASSRGRGALGAHWVWRAGSDQRRAARDHRAKIPRGRAGRCRLRQLHADRL